jgi:hypothetical protein
MEASAKRRDNISTVRLAEFVRMRQIVRTIVYKYLHYSFVTHEHRLRRK